MDGIRVAVIGGGPSGLATLKTLREASTVERPIDARLFEAEHEIGGTFRYRSYENAELVSSKQLTAFSDFRFPLDCPDHISLPRYIAYLQSYIDRYKLGPFIFTGCRIKSVSPLGRHETNAAHRVIYERTPRGHSSEEIITEAFDCTHLAICTGLHVQPNVPNIQGIEHVQGRSMHSSEYKSRSQLEGHDILILGCGETAMDIAYEAIKAPASSVTMCFRTGFLSFPKVLNRFRVFGKTFGGSLPIDGLITNLFETAYVHYTIKKSRLRSIISDRIIKKVLWFLTGTQEGCSQYIGTLPDEMLGRSYVFLNKSSKAMPFINRPYKRKQALLSWMGNEYMDLPEDADSTRVVDTCTFPTHFDSTGRVLFTAAPDRKDWRRLSGRTLRPSLVMFCTGLKLLDFGLLQQQGISLTRMHHNRLQGLRYKQDFDWLHSSYPRSQDANVRNIVSSQRPDVAFIGFVRPSVGAIPPLAEQSAIWWTALITQQMPLPSRAGHYKLLTRAKARIDYGVDHGTFTALLAKDMGASPSLLDLWFTHGTKVLAAYCLGASFVTFFRLTGPFASPVAAEIARTELWDTIRRRGIIGNLFFAVIPMFFYGLINLIALCLGTLGLLPSELTTPGVDAESGTYKL